MSSTGRGPRLGGEHDVYPTPHWCVDRLLERWWPKAGPILEPMAGDGAILRAIDGSLRDYAAIYACEIRTECEASLRKIVQFQGELRMGDFLKMSSLAREQNDVRTVITNPAFSVAEDCIRKSRELCPRADIVMLLPWGFHASAERRDFFEEFGQPDAYTLPDRPSFRVSVDWATDTKTGKRKMRVTSTDSATYCWMVWPAGPPRTEGHLVRLNHTPDDVREAALRPIRETAIAAFKAAQPVEASP